jgi:hypothetical protein
LVVLDSSNVVVGTNTFDRNPRYFGGKDAKARGGLLFRGCRDCTLTGMHVNGIREQEAAVMLEKCDDFNVSNCTILESDGAGLLLKEVNRTRVAGCVVRARSDAETDGVSLRVSGGKGNWINGNLADRGVDVAPGTARVEGNYDGK